MMDSMGGFASILQAGMERFNYERFNSISQEPPQKKQRLVKQPHHFQKKRQKVIATPRLERGLSRVTIAYEKKCEQIAVHKEEIDQCSIANYIALLNETSIECGSEQWDFAYGKFEKLST